MEISLGHNIYILSYVLDINDKKDLQKPNRPI